MRRILIDKSFEKIATNYGHNPFSRRTNGFETPLQRLEKLRTTILNGNLNFQAYVKKIEDEFSTINSLKPSQVHSVKNDFNQIVREKDLKTKFKVQRQKKDGGVEDVEVEFYKLVVEAMRYEELRSFDFIFILKKIGIKSCVYCNAQLTIITDKNKQNSKSYARLELDHYYPKSKYPFLCLNIYNLYPTCGSCNRIKSKKDAKFILYTEDSNNLEVLKFKLSKSSVVKYLTSRNVEDISFKPITHPNAINDIVAEHDEMFCIQGIYDTQKDIIEELIHKKEAYTEAYKKHLVDEFKVLFPDQALINRLLVGNYDKPEDVHKRPMSKFMQDIARDLHLIK